MKTKLIDYVDNGPIFITGHVNPDGDALGSAFALKLFFDSQNIISDVDFDITTKFDPLTRIRITSFWFIYSPEIIL